MKTRNRNHLLLPSLMACLGLILTGRVAAQTFTVLHTFSGPLIHLGGGTNADGANPDAGLVLSGNTLYGSTVFGTTNQNGAIFSINTSGTNFTLLHTFSAGLNTNSDGRSPESSLVLSGNTLYGTAAFCGTNGDGTVFSLNTNGTAFTVLHTTGGGSLVLSGNTLYGTGSGGTNGNGTVFAVNANGTGFTNIYNFTASTYDSAISSNTNGDGIGPGDLVLSGGTLYGTTDQGGTNGSGTIFSINTNGTGFTVLHTFAALNAGLLFNGSYAITNSDGANSFEVLVLSGNTLYGTTSAGGTNGNGTVFSIRTNGTSFTVLHTFSVFSAGFFTNSDGSDPNAELVLSGDSLYGTTTGGGADGNGTVFAVNTNGTSFTVLHTFNGGSSTNSDGMSPEAGLVVSGNMLYGNAKYGGAFGNGTVFSISLVPQLTINRFGINVVLTWPTYANGFTLQSTTNLGSSVSWNTNSTVPVVINGQNSVTNPISGPQIFFRLIQ